LRDGITVGESLEKKRKREKGKVWQLRIESLLDPTQIIKMRSFRFCDVRKQKNQLF
jgi:hypothetical protein